MKGFKNFLMNGNLIVIAVGLVVALAFSTLIAAFTTNIIDPLITRAQGSNTPGLGVQLGHAGNAGTFLNVGALVAAVIYFIIFMAIIYFAIVVPYRISQARLGNTVFGSPAPTKTCPACLSADLPLAATKCKYCATEQPTSTPTSTPT
ncbi:MAG: MscL family protein [Acidimicrobiales bacterium]